MSYTQLAYWHLATITPAFLVGSYLLINRKAHRANVIGLYVGGMLIAGAFTLLPGRMIHHWLFS